jgi:hypothetical protein
LDDGVLRHDTMGPALSVQQAVDCVNACLGPVGTFDIPPNTCLSVRILYPILQAFRGGVTPGLNNFRPIFELLPYRDLGADMA